MQRLFDAMRKLKAEGLGIVFVTHFMDQVYAVSDRITVLRNGGLVGEYQTANFRGCTDCADDGKGSCRSGSGARRHLSREGAPPAIFEARGGSDGAIIRSIWASAKAKWSGWRDCWAPAAPKSPACSSAWTLPTASH